VTGENPLAAFISAVAKIDKPSVLELGTKRWGTKATYHKEWTPNAARFVLSDVSEGPDVDVVADVPSLSQIFDAESFDAIIGCSVFEHFEYPWLAAQEILTILRSGGLLFIQTHQTFPLHGYPQDFYRFTREALESLFRKMSHTETKYEYPAKIMCELGPDAQNYPAYLNVVLFGIK
jgi:SAM-dependent methyltransferase